MNVASKLLRFVDRKISRWPGQNTALALRTLDQNKIKLTLNGKPLTEIYGRLGLEVSLIKENIPYSARELSKRLRSLGSERSLNELKEQGVSEIAIDKDIFVTDIWARPLHDAFHQIWVKQSCHGKMNKYIELNKRFFSFASTASTKEQKNIIITILFQVMKTYDDSLAVHSRSVMKYAEAIAREEGLSEKEIEEIKLAALLHDIGKMGDPHALWDKPGLNPDELDQTRVHPTRGVEMLKPIKWISPEILDIIFYHHSHKGYPKDINHYKAPKAGLIVAVADSFDAATSPRKYNKKVLTAEEALVDLKEKKYTVLIPITSGEPRKYKGVQVGLDQHFVGLLEKILKENPEMMPKISKEENWLNKIKHVIHTFINRLSRN